MMMNIAHAKARKPEAKLGRLGRIFSIDAEGKTIATIRYGSVIFYQGCVNEAIIFDRKGGENFENKLGVLDHLKIMLEADEWFDPQYEKYLKIKTTADARSAKTRAANKKNAVDALVAISAKRATSKKASTPRKTAAKKTSAKKATKRVSRAKK